MDYRSPPSFPPHYTIPAPYRHSRVSGNPERQYQRPDVAGRHFPIPAYTGMTVERAE